MPFFQRNQQFVSILYLILDLIIFKSQKNSYLFYPFTGCILFCLSPQRQLLYFYFYRLLMIIYTMKKVDKEIFLDKCLSSLFLDSGNQHKFNYNLYNRDEALYQLKNRDRYISETKERVKLYISKESEQLATYKAKLQEEISQNEKAVNAFAHFTEIIITIIGKFQGIEKFNRESIASIIGSIRQSGFDGFKSGSKEQLENSSEFSCIDEIANETARLLEYLSKLTEDTVALNLSMKAELNKRSAIPVSQSKIKSKISTSNIKKTQLSQTTAQTPTSGRGKSSKGNINSNSNKAIEGLDNSVNESIIIEQRAESYGSENLELRNQIRTKVVEIKKLRQMLEEEQEAKNKLLTTIGKSLNEQNRLKIISMQKDQLIEQIQRLNFRIKQLQKDKRQNYAKSLIEKQADFQKYLNLLQQVKQMKSFRNNSALN